MKSKKTDQVVDLIELLGADKKEKSILNRLLKALRADPSLIQKEYVLKRHLLHFIVLKDRVAVMQGMLDSIYKPLAFQPDRKKQSILHYAVQKFENSPEMLILLLERLPELTDQPDHEGKTALHLAVEAGKLPAIKLLINKGHADPDRKDNAGKSPRDYAIGQPKLIEALISLNLDHVHFNQQFPALDKVQLSPDATEQLTKRFAALKLSPENTQCSQDLPELGASYDSSKTQSDEATTPLSGIRSDRSDDFSSSHTVSHASTPLGISPRLHSNQEVGTVETSQKPDITFADMQEGCIDKLSQYLISGGDPDKNIFLSRSLIIQAFVFATPSEHSEQSVETLNALKEQFYLLLEYGVLENKAYKEKFMSLVWERSNCLPVLKEGIRRLSWRLRSLALEQRHQLSVFSEQLDKMLYGRGLGLRVPDVFTALDYPTLSQSCMLKQEYIQLFDLLCACKASKQADRVFDKVLSATTILGLLNSFTPAEILDYLIKLFPHFDVQQRLTACMVVKELMLFDIFNVAMNSHEFAAAIQQFAELARNYVNNGKEISETLLKILQTKSMPLNSRMQSNYECLQECLSIPKLAGDFLSAQTVVRKGIYSEGAEQTEWVELFADELRNSTLQFYQNLRVSEFYNLAWKKEPQGVSHSTINNEIQLYNMVSNFIADEILACAPIDIPRALNFFVLVARELCYSHDTGPDMNGLSKVTGALSKNPISRMKTMMNQLSPEMKDGLAQVLALAGAESNYKWQRAVAKGFQSTFMFTGVITKDVVMCFEGNENDPLALAQTLGIVFRNILDIQAQLRYKPIFFRTNLSQYLLAHYANIDEEALATNQYAASCRAVPLASEQALDLDKIESIEKLFDILADFSTTGMIPHTILAKGKTFSIGNMIAPLHLLFTDLNEKEACSDIQMQNTQKMREHLEKLFVLTKDKYFITQNPLLLTVQYSNRKAHSTHSDLSFSTKVAAATAKTEGQKLKH